MTVRGEEAAAVLPEPGPEFFAVGLRQLQVNQRGLREELKPALGVNGREYFQFWPYFKQEHEPVGLTLVTVFADEAGEMQVTRFELLAGFLAGLATGAGVGRFALVRVELATARTPEAAIGLLRAFEQEDFIVVVEAVEQGGDFVGQLHRASESGGGKWRKKPAGPGAIWRSAAVLQTGRSLLAGLRLTLRAQPRSWNCKGGLLRRAG